MTLGQQLDHMRSLSRSSRPGDKGGLHESRDPSECSDAGGKPDLLLTTRRIGPTRAVATEARYLTAILNSAIVLARIIPMQPRGWRDPRDFDNFVWELLIPEFDRRKGLHRELAEAAAEAEQVAAAVELQEGAHFMRQRRAIRDALAADGIAAIIDGLVGQLLDG